MRSVISTWAGAFVAMAAAGCAAPVASTGSQRVRPIEHATVQGPIVPAGTRIAVRLEQSLDTMETARGQQFSAVVQEPVADSGGTVIVPAGSRIRGTVHSVAGATGPRLRLRFDGIETTRGFTPLPARNSASNAQLYTGPAEIATAPYYYSGWYGYRMPYGGGPVNGYVLADGYDVYLPRDVHVPAGGTMELTLTRALVPPGTVVTPTR